VRAIGMSSRHGALLIALDPPPMLDRPVICGAKKEGFQRP